MAYSSNARGGYAGTMNHSFNPVSSAASQSSLSPFSMYLGSNPMYGSTSTSSMALNAMAGIPVIGEFFGGAAKAQQDRFDKQWQEYMTRLGYQFADDQRVRQNLWNYAATSHFMDKQNEWNSYANQSKEMQKAGLNPALMFGQGQLSGNNSSMSAPTMSPLGSGIASQGSTASSIGSYGSLAQDLKALGEAKKLGIETNYLEEQLKEQIQDIHLRNEYQAIVNRYQGQLSEAQVMSAIAQVEKTYGEIENLYKEGKVLEAEEKLKTAQAAVQKELEGKTQAEKEMAQELARRKEEIVQADLELKNAQGSYYQSAAHKADVEADNYARYISSVIRNLDAQAVAALAKAAYDKALKEGQDITNMSLPDVIAGNLDEQEMRTITGYDIADYESHKSSSSSGLKIGPVNFNTSESGSTPNRSSKVNVGDTYGVTKAHIKARGYRRRNK